MTTPPPASGSQNGIAPPQDNAARWMRRLSNLLFILLAAELGLFLLIYPWLDAWNRNILLELRPQWRNFFLSPHFRGAISGLGFLNLFIAGSELLHGFLRLVRRSGGA